MMNRRTALDEVQLVEVERLKDTKRDLANGAKYANVANVAFFYVSLFTISRTFVDFVFLFRNSPKLSDSSAIFCNVLKSLVL